MVKKAKVAPLSGMTIHRRRAPQSVGFVLPDAKDEELLPGRPRLNDSGVASSEGGSAMPPIRAIAREMEDNAGGHSRQPEPDEEVVAFEDEQTGSAMTLKRYRRGTSGPATDLAGISPPSAPSKGPDGAQRLVQALRSGDVPAAERIFGEMTRLQPVAVLRVLYTAEAKDLALACRALGMEQLQFVSIFIMTRKLGLGEEALDPRGLARIVALFEATDPDEARAALSSWREREAS